MYTCVVCVVQVKAEQLPGLWRRQGSRGHRGVQTRGCQGHCHRTTRWLVPAHQAVCFFIPLWWKGRWGKKGGGGGYVEITMSICLCHEKMTVCTMLSELLVLFLHPNFIWWYSKLTQEYVGFLQLVLWRSVDRTQGRMPVDDCWCKGSYYCISQQGREMPPATKHCSAEWMCRAEGSVTVEKKIESRGWGRRLTNISLRWTLRALLTGSHKRLFILTQTHSMHIFREFSTLK